MSRPCSPTLRRGRNSLKAHGHAALPAPLCLTIATRGSRLALFQAGLVKNGLEERHGRAVRVELLVVKTKGDVILDVPLAKVGGKGLFVKEIEQAILDGQADMAVHSLKDVPMALAPGLCLGVILERADPADVFLSCAYKDLADLPPGAVVGTSSLRRQAQVLARRPDVCVRYLRGNVDTRLRKLHEQQYDAIIMAAAGLDRLGLGAPYAARLAEHDFLPAVGQGALGIEFAGHRQDLHELLSFLEHGPTRVCVEAERGLMAGLNGDCHTPLAGYATLRDEDSLHLSGLVASGDGRAIIRQSLTGPAEAPRALGLELADRLKRAGADKLMAAGPDTEKKS